MSRSIGFRSASFSVAPWCFCSGRSWPTIRRAASWRAALVRRAEAGIPATSESGPQARIEGARPRRTERTRVRERRAAVGEIGNGGSIEEGAVGRVAVIEDIVRPRVDLEPLVDLIGGVKVEDRIGRQPRRLIGFVADKILTADEERVASDLEGVRQRIIDTGLDSVARDGRNAIARQNLDTAVDVGERAVGADLQRVEEARVDQRIAGVELQVARLQVDLGLDSLPPRRTHVLEIAEALQDRTGNGEDVVAVVGAESGKLPSERADVQVLAAAQAGFDGARHHLFQAWIGNQKCRDDAGMCRIGASQFQWRRRAVGFRIAGIARQTGSDLVGPADDRIEAGVGILAVQRAADLVFQPDIGDIVAAAAGDRKRLRDVEGIEGIESAVLIGGAKLDRTDRHRIAGLPQKYSAAVDDEVRTYRAQFGAGRE